MSTRGAAGGGTGHSSLEMAGRLGAIDKQEDRMIGYRTPHHDITTQMQVSKLLYVLRHVGDGGRADNPFGPLRTTVAAEYFG